MWTIEEFKRDTDKQILVACIVFFLVAFPYYFSAVSDGALGTSSGVTGLYEVGGDTRLVELDSGMEHVASGETWTIDDLSTDLNKSKIKDILRETYQQACEVL